MAKKVEMIGKRFGRWLVLQETIKRTNNGSIRYLCKCDCGTIRDVSGVLLRNGQSTSCGCYNLEIISKPLTRVRCTPLHNVWNSMKQRCYNQNDKAFNNYGARGIKVCDEWVHNYMEFKQWAENNGYKKGLWLDRIDNNKHYEPSNCRWATPKEQQNNKRTNRVFTYNNETHTIKEWSEIRNINYGTLMQRIKKGKEPFAAVDTNHRRNHKDNPRCEIEIKEL